MALLKGVLSQGVNNYLQKPHKSYLHGLNPSVLWEPIHFSSDPQVLCTLSYILFSQLHAEGL